MIASNAACSPAMTASTSAASGASVYPTRGRALAICVLFSVTRIGWRGTARRSRRRSVLGGGQPLYQHIDAGGFFALAGPFQRRDELGRAGDVLAMAAERRGHGAIARGQQVEPVRALLAVG